MLDVLAARFGLKYVVSGGGPAVSPTGAKHNYYSKGRAASAIGYRPRWTSLETLTSETAALLFTG